MGETFGERVANRPLKAGSVYLIGQIEPKGGLLKSGRALAADGFPTNNRLMEINDE
jgi:hypothetical protein